MWNEAEGCKEAEVVDEVFKAFQRSSFGLEFRFCLASISAFHDLAGFCWVLNLLGFKLVVLAGFSFYFWVQFLLGFVVLMGFVVLAGFCFKFVFDFFFV